MHAVRLHEFGPAANLRYEPVEDPRPGPRHVRIAVAVAGVHLIDTKIRAGERLGPYPLPELPAIPGREVAGVVDAVGADVGAGWIGRRVVGHLGAASGGYADLAVCAEASLHELPDGLGEDAAVAMIGTGRTTMAILDVAALGREDVVLVTAAAGGIGSLLVQAGRAAGATVVGLAGGAEKVARVAALGASAAIDGRRPPRPGPDRLGGDRPARAAAAGRDAGAGGGGARRGGGGPARAGGRLAVRAARRGRGARRDRDAGDGRQDRARAVTPRYVSRRRRISAGIAPSPAVTTTTPGNHQPHMPRIAPVAAR
jgi:NADPH:quinone reductase